MLITGTFKDLDDNTITVTIYNRDKTGNTITIGNTDLDDVYFTADPVSIETQCDDSFTHVMKRSCTISVITNIYLGDYLFANNMRSIVVNVFKNNDCIFAGYVTPNTYSQGYSNVYEQLDIQCIDVLSTMQYEYLCKINTYDTDKSQLELSQFSYILEQVDLTRTDNIISNYPINTMGTEIWVETWFEKVGGAYYAVETKLIKLDNDTAITTNVTRRGRMLEITSKNGELDDPVIINGKKHYKRYMWVTINGTDEINTGDWFPGNEMPEPQETQVVWEVIGVIRLNPNYYVTNEVGTAVLDDGSTIPNYDHRYGDTPLNYDLVYDTISNTIYSGTTEYLRKIPHVTYDNVDYYFEEDAERDIALTTYNMIVEANTDDFRPDRGQKLILGRTRTGTYLYGITTPDAVDFSGMLFVSSAVKVIVISYNDDLDFSAFAQNCTSLQYARIDCYSFVDMGNIFNGCTKLANIVFNVLEPYTDGVNNDFANVPSWAMIYVPDDEIDLFLGAPYDNYTLQPLSYINILPIERQ